MALLKNPNLAISASNVRIARYRVVQAKANFDVQLHVEPSTNFSVTPPENLFFAGPGVQGSGYTCKPVIGPPVPCSTTGPGNIIQHQYSFQSGIGGQGVNGLQWSAGITQTRTYNNTIINTFNPYYQATLDLSVTQPLLKNAGMNAVEASLKLAMIGADSNEAQALVDASGTIAEVEDAYWDLVAAWRNVAIQEEALNEAVDSSEAPRASQNAAPRPRYRDRVRDAGRELSISGLFCAGDRLGVADSAQKSHRRRPRRSDLDANWFLRRPSSHCRPRRSRHNRGLGGATTVRGPSGRRPAPGGRSRPRLCQESGASAGRPRRAVFQ